MFPIPTKSENPEDEPTGAIIDGNSVYWENQYGRLEVYPHTSENLIRQTQYANATWYYPDNNIDLVFRFPTQINNANIWLWKNTSHQVEVQDYEFNIFNYTLYNISNYTILNESPLHLDFGDIPSGSYAEGIATFLNDDNLWQTGEVVVGYDSYEIIDGFNEIKFYYNASTWVGNHYEEQWYEDWESQKSKFNYVYSYGTHNYYITNIPVKQNHTYRLKWQYNAHANSNGKWGLMGKLTSDTIQEAFLNNRYIEIDPAWDGNWLNYRVITIDSTQIDDNLYNFPMLVVLDNSTGDYSFIANGADIRFANMDNDTEFYYEIEKFDNTGNTYVWVNISECLTSGTDYQFLIYYRNKGASDAQDRHSLWHSQYKLVYHMNDTAATAALKDSTTNNNDATLSAGDPKERREFQVGYCMEFNQSDAYFAVPDPVAFNTDDFTIESYFNGTYSDDGIFNNVLYSPRTDAVIYYTTWRETDDRAVNTRLRRDDTGAFFILEHIAVHPTNRTFYYTALSYDNGGVGTRARLNNTQSDASDENANLRDPNKASQLAANGANKHRWNGSIDEFRVSGKAWNGSWLNATSHSLLRTSGFVVLGPQRTLVNNPPTITFCGGGAPVVVLNESTGVLFSPTIYFWVNDTDGADALTTNVYINETGSWEHMQYNYSETPDILYHYNYTNATSGGTKYFMRVSCYDGTDNITYGWFWFRTHWVFTNETVAHWNVSFRNTSVNKTTFHFNVSFKNTSVNLSTFHWNVSFSSTVSNDIFFHWNVSFRNTTQNYSLFHWNVSFQNTNINTSIFHWNVSFRSITVNDTVFYWNFSFRNSSVNKTIFHWNVSFRNSTINHTIFHWNVSFQNFSVRVNQSVFHWNVSFLNTTNNMSLFHWNVSFRNTMYNYSIFHWNTSFRNTTVNKTLYHFNVSFLNSSVRINQSTFHWNVSFKNLTTNKSIFHWNISFKNTSINSSIFHWNVSFRHISFNDTVFHWNVSFQNSSVRVNQSAFHWNVSFRNSSVAANHSVFHWNTSFRNSTAWNILTGWNVSFRNISHATIHVIRPLNESTGQRTLTECEFWVNDSRGFPLTTWIEENTTGPGMWIMRQKNSSVSANSTVNWTHLQATNNNTRYWWRVTVNNTLMNHTEVFWYRTANIVTQLNLENLSPYDNVTWSGHVDDSPEVLWHNETGYRFETIILNLTVNTSMRVTDIDFYADELTNGVVDLTAPRMTCFVSIDNVTFEPLEDNQWGLGNGVFPVGGGTLTWNDSTSPAGHDPFAYYGNGSAIFNNFYGYVRLRFNTSDTDSAGHYINKSAWSIYIYNNSGGGSFTIDGDFFSGRLDLNRSSLQWNISFRNTTLWDVNSWHWNVSFRNSSVLANHSISHWNVSFRNTSVNQSTFHWNVSFQNLSVRTNQTVMHWNVSFRNTSTNKTLFHWNVSFRNTSIRANQTTFHWNMSFKNTSVNVMLFHWNISFRNTLSAAQNNNRTYYCINNNLADGSNASGFFGSGTYRGFNLTKPFTASNYSDVFLADGSLMNVTTSVNGEFAEVRIPIYIGENVGNITQLVVRWHGYGGSKNPGPVFAYGCRSAVKRSGVWQFGAGHSSGSVQWLQSTISTNINQYIENNMIYLAFQSNHDSDGTNVSFIYVDAVWVRIFTDSFPQNQSRTRLPPENLSIHTWHNKNQPYDIYVYTNTTGAWQLLNSSLGEHNGTKVFYNTGVFDQPGRHYWTVNITSGGVWDNHTYWFDSAQWQMIQGWNVSFRNTTVVYNRTVAHWNVSFRNTTTYEHLFAWNVSFKNTSMNASLLHWNVSFKNTSVNKSLLHWNVSFRNTTVIYNHSIFHWNTSFRNTTNWNLITGWNVSFRNLTAIENHTVFHWNVSYRNTLLNSSVYHWNVSFRNTSLRTNQSVMFWNTSFKNTSVNKLIFSWNVSFRNTSVRVNQSIFHWNVSFKNSTFNTTLFHWNVSFRNTSVRVNQSTFHWNVSFRNTSVRANRSVFHWNTSFKNTTINCSVFEWNVSFKNSSVWTSLYHWNVSFKNSALINTSAFHWNVSFRNTEYWNPDIHWNVSFRNTTALVITISNEFPNNQSTDIPRYIHLQIDVNHSLGSLMNITWYWGYNDSCTEVIGHSENVETGTVVKIFTNASAYNTTHYWKVNVSDVTGNYTLATYWFVTEGIGGGGYGYILIGSAGIIGILGIIGLLGYLRRRREYVE